MTQMIDTITCSVCGHEAERDHNLDTNEITIVCDLCGSCAETEIVTDTTGRKFWLETLRFPIDEGGRVLRGPRVAQLSEVPGSGIRPPEATEIGGEANAGPHDHPEKGKTLRTNERTEPYSFPPTSGALKDCPVCGSDDVGHNHGATIEPDCIQLPAECSECKSTWREVFTLNLIDDVRVSDRYKKQQETRAAYTRETLQRAYTMYESGCTHLAVTNETGLDLETAEWISGRQLDGLGLPPASRGAVAGGKLGGAPGRMNENNQK